MYNSREGNCISADNFNISDENSKLKHHKHFF